MIKNFLDYSGLQIFYNGIKANYVNNLSNEVSRVVYEIGSNLVNSTSNIPVNKKIILVNLSNNDQLSLLGLIIDGLELHIVINNIANLPLIVTLPNIDPFICTNGDIINIKANEIKEVNILSLNNKYYIKIG